MTIQANTNAGKGAGYEFELKTNEKSKIKSNVNMYHVELTRLIHYVSGGRPMRREQKQVRLYTPKDYKDLFVEKITGKGANQTSRRNTEWLKSFSKMDGSQGFDIFFDPEIYAKENNNKSNSSIEFASKSKVTQASKEDLYLFSSQNGIDIEGKNTADLKKEIIEHLNF
jgi:hypothetical protein